MKKTNVIKPADSHAGAVEADFHGIGPNGYLKIVLHDKKYVGVGKLFAEEKAIGSDGRASTVCRLVHETPTELAPLRRQSVSIACIGIHDQKRYRFRGLLRSKKRDATRSATQAAAGKSSPTEGPDETPQTAVQAPANDADKSHPRTRSKARSRPQDMEAAIVELKWVNAMIDAGIDANIKLSTICLLASKSRATLERELMQGKLPPPRIRGRLRYWSLNDVHAYLTGRGPETPAT